MPPSLGRPAYLALRGLGLALAIAAALRVGGGFAWGCIYRGCLAALGAWIPPALVTGLLLAVAVAGSLRRPGLLAAIPLAWAVVAGLTGRPDWPGLAAALASIPLSSLTGPPRGLRGAAGAWLPAGLLALVASGAGLALLASWRLAREGLGLAQGAGGDLGRALEAVSGTLVFRMSIAALAFYVAYKAYEAIAGIALAAAFRSPRMLEVEAKKSLEEWGRSLLLMRGAQYTALREGLVLLMGLLFGPGFLPVVRSLLEGVPLPPGPLGAGIHVALAYLVSWIATRILYRMLIEQPSIPALARPGRPGFYLLVAVALGGAIIIAASAAGADPVGVLLGALTGSPGRAGPPVVDARGLDRNAVAFIEVFARGAEAAVRFLWGG